MKQKNINKLAIYRTHELETTNILDWALPYESLMLSKIEGDTLQRSFMLVNGDDKQMMTALQVTKTIMSIWGPMAPQSFNPKYFAIDTGSVYQVMTYADAIK